MTRLSVNINKFATLRNARGGNNPDVLRSALDCQRFGAQGITVHPRPDERHIRYTDVQAIKKSISVEFNIEGYPDERFLRLVSESRPAQATLVPDPPTALTSNAGWDTVKYRDFLEGIVKELQEQKIRVSVFVDPIEKMVEGAKAVGADSIELYTESYAVNYPKDKSAAIAPFVKCAKLAKDIGLKINAGHDLDLQNLAYLKQNIPYLEEVSIGHALICDAIYLGLENTIQLYLRKLEAPV